MKRLIKEKLLYKTYTQQKLSVQKIKTALKKQEQITSQQKYKEIRDSQNLKKMQRVKKPKEVCHYKSFHKNKL